VARLLAAHYTRGWRAMFDAGTSWIASLTPEWAPGCQASYHHVSWSWIVGGVVSGAAGGAHVRDVFASAVAAPLRAERDMHVGVLPREHAHRVAPMVRPGVAQLWRAARREAAAAADPSAAAPSLAASLVVLLLTAARVLVAWLEALLMTAIFNSRLFASVCLPSSNGFWTAAAVARMYGALSNNGTVALPDDDGGAMATLIDAGALARVVTKVRSDARVPSPSEGPGARALNGLGFTNWPGQVHTGVASSSSSSSDCTTGCVLGHGGMGGSVAFADIERGLSIAVLRAAYTPIALSQTSTCATTRELADCIRAHF
jgi:hypothetical protein